MNNQGSTRKPSTIELEEAEWARQMAAMGWVVFPLSGALTGGLSTGTLEGAAVGALAGVGVNGLVSIVRKTNGHKEE